jgi:hypothetical protein
MDLQRTKILLEKISALHHSMSADAKNISNIEKDLMKSYVQQLYDTLLDAPQPTPKLEEAPVEIIKSEPRATLRKPKPAPVVRPQPPAPKAEEAPDEEELAVARPARSPEKEEPAATKVAPPAPVISTKPAAPAPIPVTLPNAKVSPGLEELFAFGSAKELSEKLSQLPITDIRKAMGLNERIFTVNELFGGQQSAFDDTLKALNLLRSFDEAKQYLLQNAARQFDWAEKDRKNKAKTFIKLVKRRYN